MSSEPTTDLRRDGGYIVAPPSRHASGTSYEWVDGTLRGMIAEFAFDLDVATHFPWGEVPHGEQPGD